MLKETVLFIISLIVISNATQPEHVNVPVSFKRIGSFASGLSYGHVRATIKFSQMKKVHKDMELFLIQQIRIASTSDEQRLLETIQHQFATSTKTID